MRISFQQQFIQPIMDGTKLHTMRFGKRQYRKGMHLDCVHGPDLFHKEVFWSGKILEVIPVRITVRFSEHPDERINICLKYWESWYYLNTAEIELLAVNDGFESQLNMFMFFTYVAKLNPGTEYEGQLIWFNTLPDGSTCYADNDWQEARLLEMQKQLASAPPPFDSTQLWKAQTRLLHKGKSPARDN